MYFHEGVFLCFTFLHIDTFSLDNLAIIYLGESF